MNEIWNVTHSPRNHQSITHHSPITYTLRGPIGLSSLYTSPQHITHSHLTSRQVNMCQSANLSTRRSAIHRVGDAIAHTGHLLPGGGEVRQKQRIGVSIVTHTEAGRVRHCHVVGWAAVGRAWSEEMTEITNENNLDGRLKQSHYFLCNIHIKLKQRTNIIDYLPRVVRPLTVVAPFPLGPQVWGVNAP